MLQITWPAASRHRLSPKYSEESLLDLIRGNLDGWSPCPDWCPCPCLHTQCNKKWASNLRYYWHFCLPSVVNNREIDPLDPAIPWNLIIDHLDCPDIMNFSQTSHYFHDMAHHESVWESLYLRKFEVDAPLQRPAFSWKSLFRSQNSENRHLTLLL